jgi:hypothetical protein
MSKPVCHVLFAAGDLIVLDDGGRLECPESSLK